MKAYLQYTGASHITGKKLAKKLGIPSGKGKTVQRADTLIRWGTSKRTKIIAKNTLNKASRIRDNTNKLRSLKLLRDAGVNTPRYSTTVEGLLSQGATYPFMGRSLNHSQGKDINLIMQSIDARRTDNDFYTEYIPTKAEYRVHICNGKLVACNKKKLLREADNHPYIRNSSTGFVFGKGVHLEACFIAEDAINALGLDFGAVDVVLGEDDEVYVLEVNTAPSLDDVNLERWTIALAEVL